MPKTVTIGFGLMQRTVETVDDAEALHRALAGWEGFFSRLDAYAKQVQNVLAEHGAKWADPDLKERFGEENHPVAAAEILAWHNRLKAAIDEIPKHGIEGALEAAFELGRLVERDWWRFRRDPDLKQGEKLKAGEKAGIATRTSPEALALQAKTTRKGGRKGHEATHGTDEEKQERWQHMAAAFEEEYARLGGGRRKTAAYDIVAERFSVNRSTVIRAVRDYL